VLAEQVERNGHDPVAQIAAYKRLVELDPVASPVAQAARRMQHLATLRLGLPNQLSSAQSLFKAIGDKAGLQAASEAQAARLPRQRISTLGGAAWLGGIVLALALAYLPLDRWTGWPAPTWIWAARLATAASVAGLMMVFVQDSVQPLWRHWAAVGAGTLMTLGLAMTDWNLALVWLLSLIAASTLSSLVASDPSVPPELTAPPLPDKPGQRPFADQALRLASWLQRFAQPQEDKKP
jgi:hypothetical protein